MVSKVLHNKPDIPFNTSRDARVARSNGEFSMSHWDWTTLIWAAYEINPIAGEDALSVSTMQKYFLKPSGCYTTSKYKNKTVYYKLNEPFIKSLTEADVLEMVELQKPQCKRLRNEHIDNEVENLLRKVTVMVAAGMFSSRDEAVSCCIADRCFDDLHHQALEVLVILLVLVLLHECYLHSKNDDALFLQPIVETTYQGTETTQNINQDFECFLIKSVCK